MNAIPLFLAAALTSAKPTVVTTTFPIYDWAREIVDTNRVELVLLQQSGADLHSYSPTADDIRKIATCDLFIYNGGESDGWVERALAQKMNPRRRTLNLVEALGDAAKEEKTVEGMEHDHGHDHDHHQGHDHGHEEHELDEHVWLSLRSATTLVKAMADEFALADPANADSYRNSASAYAGRLSELDGEYARMAASAKRKTILVADRFPFRYLADDYGLEYFAAFAGCSAESEASFKTVMFLAKKVKELDLPAILVTESGNRKIADTVKRTSGKGGLKTLVLDSLQSVTGDKARSLRYIDAMKRNLEVLGEALN